MLKTISIILLVIFCNSAGLAFAKTKTGFENWTPPKEDVVNYDMDLDYDYYDYYNSFPEDVKNEMLQSVPPDIKREYEKQATQRAIMENQNEKDGK